MAMVKVGVIGATGYVGVELIRLLQQHPFVMLTYAATESYAGQFLGEVYPHLQEDVSFVAEKLDSDVAIDRCDLLFIALPHGHAARLAPQFLAAGKKVIDLGADFRLKNPEQYKQWYGVDPAAVSELNKAVYGLPELGVREAIQTASLIANPGCYPTGAILAALPALKSGLIELDSCIFDAKSGVSGAGRGVNLGVHYCEVTENFKAYHVAGQHRHTPEIEQALSSISNASINIQFTPHLLPMVRGLLTTAYFKLKTPITSDDVYEIYHDYYVDESFVRLCTLGNLPETKHVRGSNYCDIGIQVDEKTQRLVVVSVIDNLVKGASGQAIQNMNLMYQFPETVGLKNNISFYP
jgi:N-acetyl-gamma-glutamyl-phosphate reductase